MNKANAAGGVWANPIMGCRRLQKSRVETFLQKKKPKTDFSSIFYQRLFKLSNLTLN
jgi:hypothetical protein